ncbi:hypothetical protein J1N35_001594 [Gossypium stocksii]|uniref:Uncharacterized protein n=1 Tax=Gossypium stocksii TaxID=47602 RepID=A0A9D4ALF9_9ROSI|nr:hypothetical protein J1N35_001594 [Gossypium stocksii]
MEEDEFEPYHDDFEKFLALVHPFATSPVIRDLTNQSKYSYKMTVVRGKGKGVARPSEGP